MAYTAFNTPTSITQGSKFSTLVYDPNQHRIKHSDSNGRVTNYVGGIYEEITRNGVIQKIHYIGDTALFISKGSNTNATYDYEYQHRDHIGSVVAVSEGAINSVLDVQWQANGAWGERRYQQWDGPLDNLVIPTSTARGFTDHEHLDSVGLIHMNGRVYDPELGRFMSADPFVQAPYNSQSYNRYSYVFNNPLSFTDPSGYQTCSGYNTSDCGIDEIEVPGKRPSTDPCQYSMCGQDAYNYLRNFQNDQSWQNHQDFVAQATAWLLHRDAVANGGSTVWNGYTISVSNTDDSATGYVKDDNGNLTLNGQPVAMGISPNPRIIVLALAITAKKAANAVRGALNPNVSAAAKKGIEMHKKWDYGPGFQKEFKLDSGKRADAVNVKTREVIELKPNNPQAITRGEKQVEAYRKELEQMLGGTWTSKVVTY